MRVKHAQNVQRFGNPTYNSFHEAKAVCEEELDEMWDEIKKRNPNRILTDVDGQRRTNASDRIRAEAIDLAAAVLAVIIEADVLQ